MPKLVAPLLVAVALSGCFTTAGALIGSSVASSNERARAENVARGERVPPDDSHPVRTGVVLGLALDLLAMYALASAADHVEYRPNQ